jgi:hypothetical protein
MPGAVYNPVEQSAIAARGPRGMTERNPAWRERLAAPIDMHAAGKVIPMIEATFGEGIVDTVRQLLREGTSYQEIADHLVTLARTRGTPRVVAPQVTNAPSWPMQSVRPGTTAYSRASGRRRGRSPGIDAPGAPIPPRPPKT